MTAAVHATISEKPAGCEREFVLNRSARGLRRACIVALLVASAWLVAVPATAQTAETRAYAAALGAFEDGAFELAEKYFAEFLQTYPNSPQAPEAILYRARAALRRQQVKAATDLLSTNAGRAGPLADQFQYWLAESHRQSSNYQAAADAFAKVISDFPGSNRLLDASYGEALARFKRQEWPRVIELLRNTNAAFQKQSAQRPNDELVLRGHVLLAEALLENDRPAEARQVLDALAVRELVPEFRWRVQYLLCRSELAGGRAVDALAASTNLSSLAAVTGQRQFVAESHALRGAVLERLRDYAAAIGEYELNVAETSPPEYRRQALLRIIQLTLDQNKVAEAAQKLESFFVQYPQDAASEVSLLTLGEINLKRHFEEATNRTASATNYLRLARNQFERLLTNFPGSPWVGKAQLNRGWCLWFEGQLAEAQVAFRAAAEKLPQSEDRAVAQFKIADTQFQLGDLTNAIAGYRALLATNNSSPRLHDELASHALYQILRGSLDINDLPGAADAMQQLVRSFGETPYIEKGLLLLGQSFTHADRPADARALFEKFLAQYPGSPLRPEVELAIARSFVQEQNWNAALQKYESWLSRFATNELRPRAEFNYAHVNYQAGRLTNALSLFTNFLANFPNHTNAPVAKYWVGSFYYDQKDYVNAEFHFLGLFQNTNWPATPLVHEARMMAARCAAARQDYKWAQQYLLQLANDTNPPPDLTAEAFFALGDVLIQQAADPARTLEKFQEAIVAFSKVVQLFPTNSRAPLAWGRIGDCHRQLASQDPKSLENATNAYAKVITAPNADIAARSQAEVGLGQVMEQLARTLDPEFWKIAFNYYYNVVSGKNLRDGEKINPHWYKEAGLAAARLAEEHQDWEVAVRIYSRLVDALPALRSHLDKRIERAREHLRGAGQ